MILPRLRLHTILLIVLWGATKATTPAEIDAAERDLPVLASSVHSAAYASEFAVDANPETRWASSVSASAPQWLQIDFGQAVSISGLTIRWEQAHAQAYQVQTSMDGLSWQTIYDEQQADGGIDVLTNLSGAGRYLRVCCSKPGQWQLFSIWEIEFADAKARTALAEVRRRAADRHEQEMQAIRRSLHNRLLHYRTEEIVFAVRQPGKDGHWYANFSYYADNDQRPTYGHGGRLCLLNIRTGEVKCLLDDAEGGVRDPVVHYDAQKILFSYRPSGTEHYHLYEIGVDGSALRQLTDGPHDDIEPCYLSDDDIVFVSSRCKRWVQCWTTKVAILHRCDPDGGNIRAISANLEHDNTPWALPDGRLLYQRWEYVDRSQVDYHHLWTANPDGTGQMVYYGNMHPGVVMIDAKPIPGSDKVVSVFSPGHGQTEHDGVITVVDPGRGPDDRNAARTISREAKYRDPWAFSEELFLAAQGPRLVLMDDRGQESIVYELSVEDVQAGLQCHEPRPLSKRPRERVVPEVIDPQSSTGTVILADIYTGRAMTGLQRGEVKKLLVLEPLPKPINFTGGMDPLTYGGSFTLERVLGTVPVEPDGSAYFELPAMRALFFVALDEHDLAIKRMHSFLTVQPGEVTSCVGCHERRTESVMVNSSLMATRRNPNRIEPIESCPDVFDFPRDIQPILDRLCVDCHGYEPTKRGGPYAGRVVLTGDHGPMFSHAYFTMTVQRLFSDNRNQPVSNHEPRAIGSAASRILPMLEGSHYDVQATEHERRMLRLWIDVGAPYPGTYAALGCGSIGGYAQNELVNEDVDWPSTIAGAEVIQRRCGTCHQANSSLPKAISDELGISFWRFDLNDPRLKYSRHILFNLTRPERSLLLLAPLDRKAGGFGICRNAQGETVSVFDDTDDADYRILLTMVAAGKANLDQIRRFDMPGFQPRRQYLREMRRYGVLPTAYPDDVLVDPYALDRRYWRSLWLAPSVK